MGEPLNLLIVRQRSAPHPELEALAADLGRLGGLDPYTVRMRLLGPGLAQLAKGGEVELKAMAAVLGHYGYEGWVLPLPRPRFAPLRLRSLTLGSDAIEFHCEGEKRLRLERGMAAVGVLADLSGELGGQQAKRILARNAYLGRESAAVFTPEEIRQAILKGQPVFDCYLLDASGAVTAAFRALSGRFNPEGLGGRASLGAARNLEAVAELVGEYAGSFRLQTDFGLSQLPGCMPQPVRESPEALTGNLEALTRYGWLVAALGPQPAAQAEGVSPGTVLAAGLGGMAAEAGASLAGEEVATLAGTIDEALDEKAVAAKPAAGPAPLPPPPERPSPRWFSPRQARWWASSLLFGVLFVVVNTGIFQPVLRKALHAGILPGVVAVALCWGAFVCLRVKRFVENTPTSRIRSLAMGLVEVRGRALRRYALVAPMTQSACVWYRLRKYRRDRNNNWQLSSESDSSHVPFVLDDGSGRITVDPAGATVKVETEQTGYPGESSLIGAAVDGGPDEKWIEELIYEGTTLYVLGYARPARGLSAGLRERTVEALRRLKLDPRTLHRYDANGDGRLDADEWQAARDEAEQLAAAEQLNEQRAPLAERAVIGKPPRGLPFLLAEGQNGANPAGRYGWIGAALLVLGMAAFGLALKLFLEFLRMH